MPEHANGDIGALEWFAAVAEVTRETLAKAVDDSRTHGYSDAEIGQALDISRQAVGQRFGRKRRLYTGRADGTGA